MEPDLRSVFFSSTNIHSPDSYTGDDLSSPVRLLKTGASEGEQKGGVLYADFRV